MLHPPRSERAVGRARRSARVAVSIALAAAGGARSLAAAPASGPVLRARVTAVTPDGFVRIHWRWGGEGLGGDPVRGELAAVAARVDGPPVERDEEFELDEGTVGLSERPGLVPALGKEGVDYVAEGTKTGHALWLRPGVWTPPTPLSAFRAGGRRLFLTLTFQVRDARGKVAESARGLEVEFEVSLAGRTLKRFAASGPDGPTVGIVIPLDRYGDGPSPGAEFIEELGGLREYAERRARRLESLPWADMPVPRRFAFVTDCGGYGAGAGYGIRTADKEVVLAELRSLRQIGVNGFRGVPGFVSDLIRKGEGVGPEFSVADIRWGIGYPVPQSRRGPPDPAAGCPYHPDMAGFREAVRARAAKIMDETRGLPVGECWLTTVDEIGSVFDGAPEGKAHQGACTHCRAAFRDYLRRQGLTLEDFGAKSWDDVRSTYGYWARTYAEERAAKEAALRSAAGDPDAAAGLGRPGRAPADEDAAAALDEGDGAAAKAPGGRPAAPATEAKERRVPLSEKGWALLNYHSRRFNCYSSAMLFAPQREFFDAENAKKRSAVAEGRLDSPEAKQPWVLSYALRGNTFLLGGHSLDFFEFYRHADNGFVYETSNRDPRVWQWDSYLCDVGRVLSTRMGKRFGIYVKPHRGAPIQRALAAVSRGATMVYWYTYGPDWSKGDSFSTAPWALEAASRAARLIGAAEDVLYGAEWAAPARVAVVRPRTSEFFGNSASWENGKWVYAALAHAHLPVDPLDEGLILSEDLSRYAAIYVSGSHMTRAAAERLAQWVEGGGTLYTSGWGLARDEADQPLAVMAPVLGLRSRGRAELWSEVPRYGATRLGPLRPGAAPPAGAKVAGTGPFAGSFPLAVGREVLDPGPRTEVLARYADGGAAVTRHAFGRGKAYVVGFYPGVEYSSDLLGNSYDVAADADPAKRAFVAAPASEAGVRPVVDASAPLVEGVLLKNPATGRMAVCLMNWAYRRDGVTGALGLVPAEGLRVTLRAPRILGNVRVARSTWSGKVLTATREGDEAVVTVPRLDEADVLLLE